MRVDHLDDVAAQVVSFGGIVRHEILAFGMWAVTVTLASIGALARDPRVQALELEQEFFSRAWQSARWRIGRPQALSSVLAD